MSETVLVQLVTGFFTVSAAFGAVFLSGKAEQKRKRKVIKNALAAEIQLLLKFISDQGYVEKIEMLSKGEFAVINERVPSHYFSVYDALLSDIGYLSRVEASDLIVFYNTLKDVGTQMKLQSSSVSMREIQVRTYYLIKGGELKTAKSLGESFIKGQ